MATVRISLREAAKPTCRSRKGPSGTAAAHCTFRRDGSILVDHSGKISTLAPVVVTIDQGASPLIADQSRGGISCPIRRTGGPLVHGHLPRTYHSGGDGWPVINRAG